ncbi:hypothetical protein CTA1_1835 [Colletotrichum tanaceti]|uniref:Uncharacterized protein n=1 Tax=Colletotrichum tanaceti TaxID=1306861 RepID=A0A4U6XEX6_9PEZI|nr:hypothetical protein CTA1_1835 [Colletotrichum tanaceti]
MKSYVVLMALFASLAMATPSVQSNPEQGNLVSRQRRPPVRPPGNCCGNSGQCQPSCCTDGCPVTGF